MPRFFGRSYLLAVLGGVGCTLVATASLRAQDARIVGQGQAAPLATSVTSTSVASLQSPGSAHTFAAFIQEIGFDDLQARKEAAGERELRVDWKKVNQQLIGLTDDEWKTAYSILLDGSERTDAWSDQVHDTLGWNDGRFQINPSKHKAAVMAKLDSLDHQGAPIVAETIARLKQELGEASFKKLESFAHGNGSAGRMIGAGLVEEGTTVAQTGNPGPGPGAQR